MSAGIPVLTEFPYTKSLVKMDRLNNVAGNSRSRIVPALAHRYEPAALEIDRLLANGSVGAIIRVRCEVSFPLSAAYALENGVVPVSIDWYDLLQVVACRTVDLCRRWLREPVSVNADIDLPHHTALAGRRAADPVANLLVMHERGQATHLLKLSRSVQPTERYILYGERGSVELVRCEGEKLASGPTVRIHRSESKPETIYAAEDFASELAIASANMLTDFVGMIQFAPPVSDLVREARRVLETVHGAFASARDGIRTPLPLAEPVDVDGILEGRA
jgi:predicted dehydrogenase